jgi:TolA-binding protein
LSASQALTDSLIRYHLEIGEIDKAERICSTGSSATIDSLDTFLLGEIAYFNFRFEQALDLYGKTSPDSKDANDALRRMILIKGNNGKTFQNYVSAELQGRKGQKDSAISILQKLHINNSPIASWASILLIELLRENKEPEKAIRECESFIVRFQDDEKLPQVKLYLGQIYAALGNRKKAKNIYREILLKHSDSSIAPIARDELENL